MTKSSQHPEQSRAQQAAAIGLLAISSRSDGDRRVIRLEGELDLAHAGELDAELKRVEASDAREIVVDLSGLTFIDSTGVRTLLMAEARSRSDSNRLSILRAPDSVHRVFVICGVDGILPFSAADAAA